jgi:hypothetical protein
MIFFDLGFSPAGPAWPPRTPTLRKRPAPPRRRPRGLQGLGARPRGGRAGRRARAAAVGGATAALRAPAYRAKNRPLRHASPEKLALAPGPALAPSVPGPMRARAPRRRRAWPRPARWPGTRPQIHLGGRLTTLYFFFFWNPSLPPGPGLSKGAHDRTGTGTGTGPVPVRSGLPDGTGWRDGLGCGLGRAGLGGWPGYSAPGPHAHWVGACGGGCAGRRRGCSCLAARAWGCPSWQAEGRVCRVALVVVVPLVVLVVVAVRSQVGLKLHHGRTARP